MAIEIPRAEKAPQEGFLHEGERRGRGKGVAARVGAAEIAAMGKGSAQEGRPSGTASQPPPSHRNIPSECSGVSHGLFYDFAPSSMRTLVFRSAYSASRNARASAASRPPSSHTMLFSPKRTCFRFAVLTLRVQGSQGSPSGGAADGKTPAQEIAARALEAGNRDLYCIGGMSPCSVRAALRSWWRRAYSS